MPLVPMTEKPTPQQLLQAEKVRKKLLQTAQSKYLFNFKSCCLRVSPMVENNRLVGLEFQRTRVEAGKVRLLEDRFFKMETPLVISSIGSLPEPIPGLSLEWDLFPVES
jgi:hypothetical protein